MQEEAARADKPFVGYDGARARFLSHFPNGFDDPGYWTHERTYKLAAKAKLDQSLPLAAAADGSGNGSAALAVYQGTNLLSHHEKIDLKPLLGGPSGDAFVRAAARFMLGDGERALARIRRYRKDQREAPAPIKACPWCLAPFTPDSFACEPNDKAPRNMVIRCVNASCDFTRDRALPVLTVDEAIYRRLPAFLIATVDKFAGLPWLGHAGAFFGHVDRHDQYGFFGAADGRSEGTPLWNQHCLLPPDLVIQDELHLISGPLGTVAALYEVALDKLATRTWMGEPVRPKVVASTATVRRAKDQVRALFDRETAIFPPPGPDRRNSFFAQTVAPDVKPARLYVGLASPGRGPKLIFLRVLTTLLSAARAAAAAGDDADAYETGLCYFNALRELGICSPTGKRLLSPRQRQADRSTTAILGTTRCCTIRSTRCWTVWRSPTSDSRPATPCAMSST